MFGNITHLRSHKLDKTILGENQGMTNAADFLDSLWISCIGDFIKGQDFKSTLSLKHNYHNTCVKKVFPQKHQGYSVQSRQTRLILNNFRGDVKGKTCWKRQYCLCTTILHANLFFVLNSNRIDPEWAGTHLLSV